MGALVSKVVFHSRERKYVSALEPIADSKSESSSLSSRLTARWISNPTEQVNVANNEAAGIVQPVYRSSERLEGNEVLSTPTEFRLVLVPIEKPDGSPWQKECLKNCRLAEAFHLLSPEECKILIESKTEYNRSKVQNDDGTTRVDESRTSSTAWHQGFSGPAGEVYHKLLTRAEQVCKIPCFWGALESGLQLVKYDDGQKFSAHFDSSNTATNKKRGRVTLLVYLNDDFEGGETNFETIKCKIRPVAGKGVLWYTHMENENQAHLAGKHSGETVRNGTKYIATQWWRLVEAASRN